MSSLEHLFAANRAWAAEIKTRDPGFFERLSHQQTPEYLWIGCSDSRVPANQIVGMLPGELFVHRNVANVVVHTDLNCLSAMHYAVDVLKVRHIIVCGHHGCGGVAAAWRNDRFGLVDNWLRHVQDVREKHAAALVALSPMGAPASADRGIERLCELNVIEQVVNVGQTTVVEDAWARGQELSVHGWIYRLDDGLVRDMGMSAANWTELSACYQSALNRD